MTTELRPRTSAITRTTLSLVAGVLLLPGLLTACSSTPEPDTAAGGSTGSGAAGLAACMRDAGYDMEDPASGEISLSPPDGVDADQWRETLVGCTGTGGGAGEAAPAEPMPGADQMARDMGECMREAGHDEFPDDPQSQAAYEPSGDAAAYERDRQRCSDEAYASVEQVN